MSGKRLGSFRAGDRSEYLALFGLSRVAFVDPIPRQEDFGVVDFLCVLTRKKGQCVYPESAFFVQVKSVEEDVELDADAIRWISHHMDHPLFLCISDKGTSELTFYSLARIWFALFKRWEPNKITLKPECQPGSKEPVVMRESHGTSEFDVYLGEPILRQELSALENNPDVAFKVLDAWIRLDSENIARRRLGRIAVCCFSDWATNVAPAQQYSWKYYHGPNYESAERALTPILTALGRNYMRFEQHTKLAAVRAMLNVLEPFLDEPGRQIANGSDQSGAKPPGSGHSPLTNPER